MITRVTRLLEAPLAVGDSPVEPRDAIVVLGAPLTPAGALTPILEERLAAAIALYRAGGGRYLVASGGTTHGAPRAEADALADGLRAAGIPDVLVENRSLTTRDNAFLTAELLAPLGARRVWLITQPFHAKRAALLFNRAGLDAKSWHIADSVQYRDPRRALRWLAREYGAWALLALRRR